MRGSARRNDPTSPTSALARVHEEEVLRLRSMGLSYSKIAARIGDISKDGARKALVRALAKLKTETAERANEYVEMQLERLRVALEAIMPRVEMGELEAIETMLRIEQRTSKLLALDAPEKWATDDSGRSVAPGAISMNFDTLTEGQLESLRLIGVVKEAENESTIIDVDQE